MRLAFLVFLIVALSSLLSGCGKGYNTLEESIQSQWKTPIEIKNVDWDSNLVIYLDRTQYVFDVYEYKNDKYYYDSSQSSGWTATSDHGIPFLVRADERKGIGKFLWGAVYSDKPVNLIVIKYKNGETQETEALNNTFILKMPESLNNVDSSMLMGELVDVKAFAKDNNEIVSWKD